MDGDEILKAELQKALVECQRLRDENAQLRLRVHQSNKYRLVTMDRLRLSAFREDDL